ncbi:ATP synthase F0, A subunit [Prevotella sp. DNF00663]|uniref:F0F1 ATP synthase subunit A n=1 Tax=unclassified Prevotella TaxID=2638335 RepID=UPI000512A01F|nr:MULTISPECIES: F0F1 ATP synthase subunit A [unclassified Prevotella]KGI60563.1 ATP synthase subunit A [Prevotella sp. S7 MS 2]KXB85702.1 ATP synthase F0, A subunit [Prevotella sp. DNF00663]
MRQIKNILLLLAIMLIPLNVLANEQKGEKLDIPTIVLEHLSDSYEWHIVTYKGKHIGFQLPIIVRSAATGEWTFCTAKSLPSPFYFDETHHGKIYEKLPNGETVRPLDLSITKVVAQIWIVVFILLGVFIACMQYYKKVDVKSDAPKGFIGFIEMLVMYIHDDVIKPAVGEAHCKQYAPYLLTIFFFIFLCNIIGLLPIFPGGTNITGNINITLFLALCTMIAINVFGSREYWKDIFWPNVPIFLKAPVPLMPVIELFGVFTKPFALMIRLFANMMAGHAVILSFTCVIFLGWSMGVGYGIGLNIFSIIMLLFMNLLEVLVAFIQAYVFTMLSAVFIGLAHPEHHPAE